MSNSKVAKFAHDNANDEKVLAWHELSKNLCVVNKYLMNFLQIETSIALFLNCKIKIELW